MFSSDSEVDDSLPLLLLDIADAVVAPDDALVVCGLVSSSPDGDITKGWASACAESFSDAMSCPDDKHVQGG